jgi:hypothetical protein
LMPEASYEFDQNKFRTCAAVSNSWVLKSSEVGESIGRAYLYV